MELGPGLLTTIFDGIQRPLKAIALSSGDCFIPRGVDVPALDRKKQWEFNPHKVKVKVTQVYLNGSCRVTMHVDPYILPAHKYEDGSRCAAQLIAPHSYVCAM